MNTRCAKIAISLAILVPFVVAVVVTRVEREIEEAPSSSEEASAVVCPETTATIATDRCILIVDVLSVEYYHPTVNCTIERSPNLFVFNPYGLSPAETSGCFLPATQQVVMRESAVTDTVTPSMVYSLADDTATELPLPFPEVHTYASTSALLKGRCLSCGGYGPYDLMHECYAYACGNKWTPIASMPKRLRYAASVALGDDYYVIGGESGEEAGIATLFTSNYDVQKEMYRYNAVSDEWTTETPMDAGRRRHAAVALSDTELLVCGGQANTNAALTDCAVYSTTTSSWTATGALNTARRDFAMVVFGGEVYAMGGAVDGLFEPAIDTVEVYDRATQTWRLVDKHLQHGHFGFVAVAV